MAITITNADGVVFTFQDGDIFNVESTVASSIEQYGLSGLDWTYAFLADFEGVRKIITLSGALTDASTSRTSSGSVLTIAQQKAWLEALQTGQQTPQSFVSDFENETVMVGQFRTNNDCQKPNELNFTMTLNVGSF